MRRILRTPKVQEITYVMQKILTLREELISSAGEKTKRERREELDSYPKDVIRSLSNYYQIKHVKVGQLYKSKDEIIDMILKEEKLRKLIITKKRK